MVWGVRITGRRKKMVKFVCHMHVLCWAGKWQTGPGQLTPQAWGGGDTAWREQTHPTTASTTARILHIN